MRNYMAKRKLPTVEEFCEALNRPENARTANSGDSFLQMLARIPVDDSVISSEKNDNEKTKK
jgi:hypothetical protein